MIIKMQTRLQDLLSASTTAEEAAQRFSDLRVVAALVCASWPMAQDLLTPDLVSVAAGHVRESDGRGLYSPPRSPTATAALLQAAEAVLDMDDLEQALTSFRRASCSGLPSLAPWSYILDRNKASCSERLLLAAEPSIRAFRRDGGASGLRAPTRTVGYQPEHIAAALEHGHLERHLAAFDWGPTPEPHDDWPPSNSSSGEPAARSARPPRISDSLPVPGVTPSTKGSASSSPSTLTSSRPLFELLPANSMPPQPPSTTGDVASH
ncbi:hypothetical protein AB0C40_35090 [Streptomyces brevispora]|uniref:hypothetical protein n=1 Tax=Streptomyces brevispora TaxID=887462 RepID=UPI0033F0BE3B